MEKEFTEGDAFVAAYSEYFGVVYKEALKYSGNHHIAEECYDADSNHTVFLKFGKRCIVFLFVGFVNIFCTVVNKEWFLLGVLHKCCGQAFL